MTPDVGVLQTSLRPDPSLRTAETSTTTSEVNLHAALISSEYKPTDCRIPPGFKDLGESLLKTLTAECFGLQAASG